MSNYPICDTDLFYKIHKSSLSNKLFDIYGKIKFSDAVYQELQYNASNASHKPLIIKSYFIGCLEFLNERISEERAVLIQLKDLNQIYKNLIKINLIREGIIYDEDENKFILDYNVGEKVTIIYAAILGIEIILSDDKGSLNFAKKFLKLKVIRLAKVLRELGFDEEKSAELQSIANHKNPKLAAEAISYFKKHNKVKNFVDTEIVLDYKKNYEYQKSIITS